MTELPVAIIFDNVKLALALIRLSLNVRLVNGGTFHLTNIQNSNDFKEQKMCIRVGRCLGYELIGLSARVV